MKGQTAAAARRYARALLDVALDKGDPASLRGELRDAASALKQHSQLYDALTHPSVGTESRKRLVAAVWGDRGASELFVRLMDLLAERDRLALLPAIEQAFVSAWNSHRGVVSAKATTAVALDETQAGALVGAIEKAAGVQVELETDVDPGVLGGVCVRFGGRVFDGTVRAQLKTLHQRLVSQSPGA